MSGEEDDDEQTFELQNIHLNTANQANKSGQYESAIKSYQLALKLMQQRLGTSHQAVLQLKVKMATILSAQTREGPAERIFKEVMTTTNFLLVKSEITPQGDVFEPLARESINWLQRRAVSYYNNGKHEKADFLFREIYDVSRGLFGDIDTLTKQVKRNLDINAQNLPALQKPVVGDASQSKPEVPRTRFNQVPQNQKASSTKAEVSREGIPECNLLDIPLDNDGQLGFDDNVLLHLPNDSAAARASDTWFELWLERHTQPLLADYRSKTTQPKDRGHRRVRVAVIDTGIDMTNTEVDKRKGRIVDFQSWIPGEPDFADDSGHGTHVAMSLLRVAPEADLYVARVFARTFTSSTQVIGPAIRHAVDQWDVDIISMSFGAIGIERGIFEAIGYAAFKNVLMFAAASNNGKNERVPRAYPARDARVFSISSTDGLGSPSSFNPSPQEGDLNFCILGESVSSASINGRTVRKSGTSMATPIAAGFAALIIEFARQPRVDGEVEVEDPDSITTYQGMRQLFKTMSYIVDGYRYLVPWRVLSVQQDLSDVLKARNEVAREISKLLTAR